MRYFQCTGQEQFHKLDIYRIVIALAIICRPAVPKPSLHDLLVASNRDQTL